MAQRASKPTELLLVFSGAMTSPWLRLRDDRAKPIPSEVLLGRVTGCAGSAYIMQWDRGPSMAETRQIPN